MIQVLHNPRCGKSREAIALIEATGKAFEIIKYLDHPQTFEQLKLLIGDYNKLKTSYRQFKDDVDDRLTIIEARLK